PLCMEEGTGSPPGPLPQTSERAKPTDRLTHFLLLEGDLRLEVTTERGFHVILLLDVDLWVSGGFHVGPFGGRRDRPREIPEPVGRRKVGELRTGRVQRTSLETK